MAAKKKSGKRTVITRVLVDPRKRLHLEWDGTQWAIVKLDSKGRTVGHFWYMSLASACKRILQMGVGESVAEELEELIDSIELAELRVTHLCQSIEEALKQAMEEEASF